MIRAALFFLMLLSTSSGVAAASSAETAKAAALALTEAADLLAEAEGSRDRIKALSETVRAYEDGLAALRQGMREAALGERALRTEFDREAGQLSTLLGALSSIQSSPEALVLSHPGGPLANTRAGMILADVMPALEARVSNLRTPLEELAELRSVQQSAKETLEQGLNGVRTARTALSIAISERRAPEEDATDVATLQALVNSADTLEGFATTIALLSGPSTVDDLGFSDQAGALALPALGQIITGYNEPDAEGRERPGILLATAPQALVTSPHAATVRFAGTLLDLGAVAILEPEAGYLMVLAGLETVYISRGEVLDLGAPLGLMGDKAPGSEQNLIDLGEGSSQSRTETLYIEFYKGDETLDPAKWFVPAED